MSQNILTSKFLQSELVIYTLSYTIILVKNIILNAKWIIKAPHAEVFNALTDFEKWPEYFPKVAESLRIVKRDRNNLYIEATVKSFGQKFPVKMKTQILPDKGFISDNESPKFGTSGHEELFLTETIDGTVLNYTYHISIHNRWLRLFAKPLIGWISMKLWEKSVIDELRKRLEK